MMRALVLVLVALLAGCGMFGSKRPDPPVAVQVRVAVPGPCGVAHPECRAPAYDAAQKDMPGDTRIKLLRAEAAEREDCLRRYRLALDACRTPAPAK